MEKIKELWIEHKTKIIIGVSAITAVIIGLVVWKKSKKSGGGIVPRH